MKMGLKPSSKTPGNSVWIRHSRSICREQTLICSITTGKSMGMNDSTSSHTQIGLLNIYHVFRHACAYENKYRGRNSYSLCDTLDTCICCGMVHNLFSTFSSAILLISGCKNHYTYLNTQKRETDTEC